MNKCASLSLTLSHAASRSLSFVLPLALSEPVRQTAPAVRPRRLRLAGVAVTAALLDMARLSHLLLLLGLQGHVSSVATATPAHDGHVVLVVAAEHAALLVVGGHLDVVAALGAAARAAPPEEDVHAVPCLGAEGEIDERVEQRRRVHRPFHDGLVALSVEARDEAVEVEGHEAALHLPVGHDVVDVEELVGGARGLVEEDEEEGDDREPELGRAQLPRAAAARLHEQGPPRDEEENHRQHEGQDRR